MTHHTSSLLVRPLEPGDFEQWLPCWLEYCEFYAFEVSEEVTQTTWARFFEAQEPMHCAVAVDDGRILGIVHYLYHRSTWSTRDSCYLEDLFVVTEDRGRQVGKRLIEHVQRAARAERCGRLYWHTQDSNHRAQRLYDWIADKPGIRQYRMPLE